jgi:uncharacterized protein (DUF2252 family)
MRKTNAKPAPTRSVSSTPPGAKISPDERRAEGKALRNATPRAAHGGWNAPEDRRDPIELLRESNEGRIPELIPIRFGRMAQSPFAFYRGAAAVMAADLASTPRSGLSVQACGDAHIMNFGGFATPERNIFFDISDFDETLPAPWEWDVKRLGASVIIAAHHINLPDSEAKKAATESICSYRERMLITPQCARSMSGTIASISTVFLRSCRQNRRSSASGNESSRRGAKAFQRAYFQSWSNTTVRRR